MWLSPTTTASPSTLTSSVKDNIVLQLLSCKLWAWKLCGSPTYLKDILENLFLILENLFLQLLKIRCSRHRQQMVRQMEGVERNRDRNEG